MKKNDKLTFLFSLLILAFSTVVSAQNKNDEKKNVKQPPNLLVLNESQAYSLQNSKQLFKEVFQTSPQTSFTSLKTELDPLGFTHEKMQQYFNGIKVEFATVTLNSKNGSIQSVNSAYFPIAEDFDTSPTMSNTQAFNLALNHVGASKYMWQDAAEAALANNYKKPTGELVIFPALKNVSETNRLAYKFDIYAISPLYRADVYIDAKTGQFIMENKRIHDANVPATGTSLYNGNVSFTADNSSGPYRLRQTADGGGIQTFDLNNSTNYNNAVDITSSSTNFTSNPTGVQAHFGAEKTYKYYSQKYGRNSYNNTGGVIKSYVSYSTNYVNAFWDGTRMTYGDGDGSQYGPLVSLDICGHEITHGVTEYSANLAYSYQSGALNESFSDIFGESIEKFASGSNDWLMGDDIGAGGSGGALRSMSNPNAFGDPDTYQGTNWYSGSGDSGGVHTNSGVQNFWFYVLSVGKSGTNDKGDSYNVSGIGMDKAGAIAYRNLTVYLNSNSQYSDARAGAIQAAVDLYGAGSAEEIATTNAWYAVGVGAAYDDGTPPPPGDCQTGDIYLSITFDNYPEETGWTLKNSSGTTIDSASYSSSNPDGSTVTKTFSNLAVDDYTFTITDAYGDGICCAYGNGSYTLSSDAGVIFSGGSFGSSEATAFCIESGGADTQAPSAPTNLTASNITETTASLSWNASSDNVGVTGYDVFQGSTNIGSVTGTSANITGLTAATSYSFKVRAHDAAGNNSGFSNTVTFTTAGGGNNNNYCDSQGNNSSYEWIDLVKLNNLNHPSGNDGGYKDNTNLSANAAYGSNKIYISAGFSGSSYREYWKIWIDYDQNGTFDSNEVIASGSSRSSGTLSATFNIPTSALSGATRMRVSMKYNNGQTACETFSYGEVEDYTVIIGGNGATQGVKGGDSNASLSELGIKLFPNPVKGNILNVEVLNIVPTDYTIYNLMGQIVGKGIFTESIDVSRLQGGVYIIEVNADGNKLMKRFVKE
jgi:Zn-dependent metalloprotease/chitodextrinase